MPNDKWWPAKRDKMTQHNLKKTVTFVQAIAIVVGMIIGSGIFLKPSIVFHNAGSPMLGLLAWIIGGISFDPGKRFGGNLYFFRHLQYPYGSFGIRAVDLFRVRRFRGFYTEKKRPLTTNRYRVPLYLITPIVGILGGVYILISTIVTDPVNSTVGIIITLAGLPVYYFTRNR